MEGLCGLAASTNDPAIIPPGRTNSPRSLPHSFRRRNASQRNRLSRMDSRPLTVCLIHLRHTRVMARITAG